jgi:M3 family oligoendopeptidase
MTKFSEMKYERPDMDAVKKEIAELVSAFKEARSYDEARALFIKKDELEKHIDSMATLSNIRHSIDTRDEFYDKEAEFWDGAAPELEEAFHEWTLAMLASPHRERLAEEFGEIIFRDAEIEEKSFDPSIVPLMQEENSLTTEYQKLLAGAQIPFRGSTYTIAQMGKFKIDADDDLRREAWIAEGSWYKDNQDKLDEIYDKLVRLRHEMSLRLGLKDAVDFGYLRMKRNCYDRGDIAKFRDAVVKYLVPLADSIKRAQAERTGVPYPMSFADANLMYRDGNAKPAGDADAILKAAGKFYEELSPETGEFFNMMLEGELMDLLAKEGKQGGGYCTTIYDYEVPFIFANFNGTTSDVETVTHEAGHAFADWVNRQRVPASTIWPGLEGCEVHSMSMEFFAWKAAGDFFGKDKEKFLNSHLAGAITFIPYGTMVDHFQHSVYEHPEMSPAQRHSEWKRLLGIYMPWLRLDGEIPFYSEGMGWQRQHHIYIRPFYYIDYCLAQTVALEFWAMIQEDPEAAWAKYMKYTRQGGSDVFTKLLEKAGLGSPFDEATLRGVCSKAERWLAG